MPQVFQAVVNDILRDFLNRFIFVYLDDVLIYWKLEEHQAHVHAPPWKRILCQSLKLWISLTVCVFSGLHPGRRAGEGRSGQSPSGQGMANSHITEHIQRFLGFANFYRWFIRNYSPVASPLTCLTSTNVPLCLFFSSPHPCTEKLWCGRLLAVKPPWRSGETCWRQWSNHSPYGLLTRT